MWQQNYTPLGSLPLSALVAALPIFTLLFLLGIRRKPAWIAALSGLAATILVAIFLYGMPVGKVIAATTYGAAFGLFPIGWIVIWAVFLYRLTLDTGKFESIKHSIGSLTQDRRLQALLIAFAFGAFVEGAAGFGTPVAVASAMLAGLGFTPFYAAAICLLANTAPVAFGSIAIPIVTLAGITGLPLDRLSAGVGRICAPVSLIVPAYLVLVMGGWKALGPVLPAAVLCGVTFAGMQFVVSNFVGPQLTDLASSLTAICALVVLLLFWKPKDQPAAAPLSAVARPSGGQILLAWSPYLLLVACVLLWGYKPMQGPLNSVTVPIQWPGLHNLIARMPPVTTKRFALPGCLQPQLALGFGNRLPDRHAVDGAGAANPAAAVPQDSGEHAAAARFLAGDTGGGPGPRISDELLRRHGDSWIGIRGHRRIVPVLQRAAGMDGRVLDGLRHIGERAVRQSAGGDGIEAGTQPGSDGGVEFGGRGDGKDDQPVEHRGGNVRNGDGAGGRIEAIPVHLEAQRFAGEHDWGDCSVLRVCCTGLAAVERHRPFSRSRF